MNSDDLLQLSASDAVRAMTDGSISAERYASALLEQCDRGRHMNAFITLDPARVLASARAGDHLRNSGAHLGPLHGLPIPIKDSINTKDYPTTAGTPALRDFYPRENAPVFQRLLDAGAIVLGKTNLHELSMGWTSNNEFFGAVRNPYDLARIPGGSSGGTAAAIAARMAPLGVAEDTEGSIRVPAALCGIAGFRPTTGRYPSAGTAPISPLFDQVGPHAGSVSDLALFDSVITGVPNDIHPLSLRDLTLGIDRRYWFAGLDSEVERVSNAALRKLQDGGVKLVEVEVADLARLIQQTTPQVQVHDFFLELPRYLHDSGANVTFAQIAAQASQELKDFFAEYGPGGRESVSEEAYRSARDIYLPALRRNFREYFACTGVAAIVFPATMVPAPLIGEDQEVTVGNRKISFVTAIARNIAPGSTAGIPGLVMPAGLTKDGLPVALEFDGPAGGDRALLDLGWSMEQVLGQLAPPLI